SLAIRFAKRRDFSYPRRSPASAPAGSIPGGWRSPRHGSPSSVPFGRPERTGLPTISKPECRGAPKMAAEDSELTVERFIGAPPAVVWKAWSMPAHLAKWWIPAPIECKVLKLNLRPGGGFETHMREDGGAFQPHVEGCFL